MKSQRIRNLRDVCQTLLLSLLSIGLAGTASAQLEITEIMYNPLTSGDNVWEWIEVRNTSGSDIDLDGYLAFSLGDAEFASPNPTVNSANSIDTVIPAGGVGIIFDGYIDFGSAQNHDADLVRQAWGIDPSTPVIAGDFWPGLSNSTGSQGQSIGFWETLADYQADLGTVDPNDPQEVVSFTNTAFSIDYSSGFPTVGGSGGPSLAWSGNGSNQDGSQWVISSDGDASGAVTSTEILISNTDPINNPDDLGNPGLLPSGSAATGLHITEILYNPAGDEPDWEWFEVYNNTGSAIDFGAGNYIVDDINSVPQAGPNVTGTLANGEVGVMFNVDSVDPNDFAAAWGGSVNLLPVTDWGNMGLNNSNDTIGIWDDPNAYAGDHEVHANTVVSQEYGVGDFPSEGQGQAIYLAQLGLDTTDGNNWVGALLGDGLSFNATAVFADPNSLFAFHEGGDEGSPGEFGVFTLEDADFNGDGFVDGKDFLTWQLGLGTGTTLAEGDANGDGVVNGADLAIWQGQYGTQPLAAVSSAVPEPTTIVLLGMALAPLGLRRRRS